MVLKFSIISPRPHVSMIGLVLLPLFSSGESDVISHSLHLPRILHRSFHELHRNTCLTERFWFSFSFLAYATYHSYARDGLKFESGSTLLANHPILICFLKSEDMFPRSIGVRDQRFYPIRISYHSWTDRLIERPISPLLACNLQILDF